MDTIAQLLTSIRNAEMAGHAAVTVPHSRMNEAIVKLLVEKGYAASFEAKEKTLHIVLIKDQLHHYRRLSKPGRRLYSDVKRVPRVLGGRGMVVLSSPEGVISDAEARKRNLGGELICEVY